MRSLVFRGTQEQAFELTEHDAPEPSAGEVLVDIECTTICGSDLHTITGRRVAKLPIVLGHEIVGTVSALGPDAPRTIDGRELSAQDHIVWSLVVACGACDPCRRRHEERCAKRFKYGHESTNDAPCSGGLSDRCLLRHGTAIAHVPEGLDDRVAASTACAGATAAAVLRRLGNIERDSVVVFGCGLLGLCAIDSAKRAGASRVIAVDVDGDRLARATKFGADAMIFGNDPDDTRTGLSALLPAGADVAIEASGSSTAATIALACLALGGRAAFVGSVFPSDPISIVPEDLVRRRLTVFGQHNYEPRDLLSALAMMRQSSAPYAECFTDPIPLADVGPVLASGTPSALRIAVRP
ncbi:MAG: alcohol dehydrogenase catalytic domain-containing protein [Planctomycetes bacterium]|nr:alcohol dehydrogenase catalytic domain-containing protein [Planctomycetota bacterium]